MNMEQKLVVGACEVEVKPPVAVRAAAEDDVDAIVTLINQWAEHGLTLGRDEASVRSRLEDFVVGSTSHVIACAALETVHASLGEIRSVSVAHDALGTGAGRLVVEGLLDRALASGMQQVVLLTKTPAFFAKLGFEAVDVDALPAPYVRDGLVAKGRSTEGRTAMSKVLSQPAALVADPV